MTKRIGAPDAARILCADAPKVIAAINAFTSQTFRTRGGRLGSGMGSLLEALWVYHMNNALMNEGGPARDCELAWLQDHEPADFACLIRGAEWEPERRHGELFRIEAKSMNIGVDEAKVTDEASFVDDLGADSLDTVELVMAFEEEFGCEIPDDAAEKITTVKDAIEYIKSHAS